MNCIIRNAQMSDYDSVVRILNQGQALHINWRPDIYKPNDALLPKAVFEEIVKGDTFYIAENEGNVIGILELIFRHIESPAQVTRDIVFIDTMAVDEPYRGMGVGHLFFEKVKENSRDAYAKTIEKKNPDAYTVNNDLGTDIGDAMKEYTWGVIGGGKSLDDWDSYVDKINGLGLQDVLDELKEIHGKQVEDYQKYLEEYNK